MGAICSNCETEFDIFLSSCPKCGSGDRKVNVTDAVNLKDSLEITSFKEFFETNRKLKWLTIGISWFSILLGLVLNKWEGIVVGIILWVVSYFLGHKAEIKVKEIETNKVE